MNQAHGWRRGLAVGLMLAAADAFSDRTAMPPAEAVIWLQAYLRYDLTKRTAEQSALLAAARPAEDQAQVAEAAALRQTEQNARLRRALEAQFGATARERFAAFMADWTDAEQRGDPEYLRWISGVTGLSAGDYAGLRTAAFRVWLTAETADGANWLGAVETWLTAGTRDAERPPLRVWLDRATGAARAADAGSALADAEASAVFVPVEEDPAGSALEQLAARRGEKRAADVARAQAQMQQIADERRAWEEEHGAELKRRADLDAEHVKQQADKLAAAEKDALEQRKNSWNAKLLNILGATVSTFTGAVTGEIGKRAAERVTEEIFK